MMTSNMLDINLHINEFSLHIFINILTIVKEFLIITNKN